jgi:hypothetical protein
MFVTQSEVESVLAELIERNRDASARRQQAESAKARFPENDAFRHYSRYGLAKSFVALGVGDHLAEGVRRCLRERDATSDPAARAKWQAEIDRLSGIAARGL